MKIIVQSKHTKNYTKGNAQAASSPDYEIVITPERYQDWGGNPDGIVIIVESQGSTDKHMSCGNVVISIDELQKIVDFAVQNRLVVLPGTDSLKNAYEALRQCLSLQTSMLEQPK